MQPLEVVCMGEILIDFIGAPAGRPLEDAESFLKKPGGAPANVAVGLARLGRRSAFIGMAGDDAFGRFLRQVLDQEGVDTRSLVLTASQPTTLAFVAKDARGVPSFSFYRHPGADLSLRPEDIREEVFGGARCFHFGSLSLVAPPAADATWHCLDLARKHGLLISYDPNYRPALWKEEASAREQMLAPLGRVDLLKVSEEELCMLSGQSEMEAGCRTLAARGPRTIVVTRGERGLYGWNEGRTAEVAGQPVQVVDTTGCGDSSVAGLLTALLESGTPLGPNLPIQQELFAQALGFANRCAAITATQEGAIPAMPHREDLT